MNNLISYGKEINSIFQLLGNKENDISKSIAWALSKCPVFMHNIVNQVFPNIRVTEDDVVVKYQQYSEKDGITDIELKDNNNFHIIIEAKRGWQLPDSQQLNKYTQRKDFANSNVAYKAIVTMSECSQVYANLYMTQINGVPIHHMSWRDIFNYAEASTTLSNNQQKHLLVELQEYLRGIMNMQNKDSNWVYVVSLGKNKPDNCNISWIDIVKIYNMYFCPVGNGWPKEPPNYIGFRYDGELQAIHHIEKYDITKNIHNFIPNMPDTEWDDNFFVFTLGTAIKPLKQVKTGNIYRSGRVRAMLDTLLTSDTISEARDISKSR